MYTTKKVRAIVDECTLIPASVMHQQLGDTGDIVNSSLEMAPPNKRLMRWKATGGVDWLLKTPAQHMSSGALSELFSTRLLTDAGEDEPDDKDPLILDDPSTTAEYRKVIVRRKPRRRSTIIYPQPTQSETPVNKQTRLHYPASIRQTTYCTGDPAPNSENFDPYHQSEYRYDYSRRRQDRQPVSRSDYTGVPDGAASGDETIAALSVGSAAQYPMKTEMSTADTSGAYLSGLEPMNNDVPSPYGANDGQFTMVVEPYRVNDSAAFEVKTEAKETGESSTHVPESELVQGLKEIRNSLSSSFSMLQTPYTDSASYSSYQSENSPLADSVSYAQTAERKPDIEQPELEVNEEPVVNDQPVVKEEAEDDEDKNVLCHNCDELVPSSLVMSHKQVCCIDPDLQVRDPTYYPQNERKKHNNRARPKPKLHCCYCRKYFPPQTFQKHIKVHELANDKLLDATVKCALCDERFAGKKLLGKHVHSQHSKRKGNAVENVSAATTSSSDVKPPSAKSNGKSTNSTGNSKNCAKIIGDQRMTCPLCGVQMVQSLFLLHLEKSHPTYNFKMVTVDAKR